LKSAKCVIEQKWVGDMLIPCSAMRSRMLEGQILDIPSGFKNTGRDQ